MVEEGIYCSRTIKGSGAGMTEEEAWANLVKAMRAYLKYEPDYEFVVFNLENEINKETD